MPDLAVLIRQLQGQFATPGTPGGVLNQSAKAVQATVQQLNNSLFVYLDLETTDHDTDDIIVHTKTLTGTVAKTAGGSTLTGTGSAFLSELVHLDLILVGTELAVINNVTNDTSASIYDAYPSGGGAHAGTWAASGSGITATRESTVFEIQADGVYLLTGRVEFEANAAGVREVSAGLRRAGSSTDVVVNRETTPLGTDVDIVPVVGTHALEAGDQLRFGAFQNSGADLDSSQFDRTDFAISYLLPG